MSNEHHFKNSTSIKSCDYDDSSNTMIITFTSGSTYHYPSCKKEHYEALKAASSPGSHFHKSIRNKITGIKKG